MSTMFPVDDPDRRPARAQHEPCRWPPRASRCSTPGTPWACGAPAATTIDLHRRVRARGAGAGPPARSASIDPPLQVILTIALSTITGVYLGVAEGARDAALERGGRDVQGGRPARCSARSGSCRHRLQVAGWALDGALAAGRRRPDAVDGHGRRRDGRQARGRPRRHRGVRRRHGARRRRRLLQGLPDRAGLPRHPGRQVPPASGWRRPSSDAGQLALGLPADQR